MLTRHYTVEIAMPCPYSADLRERVLAACEHRQSSRAAIARWFQVSESTVYNWLTQARLDGRRQAKPHAGGPAPKLDTEARRVLQELVANDNDATLDEYCERLEQRTGCRISRTTMCVVLQSLHLLRKKRRSTLLNKLGTILSLSGTNSAKRLPRSIQIGSYLSTRRGSTRT